jgi:hypothetical protein
MASLVVVALLAGVGGPLTTVDALYESARRVVDRFPHLLTHNEPGAYREGGPILIPRIRAPETYGPFGADTLLPSDCYLYERGVGADPEDIESDVPLGDWPDSLQNQTATHWHALFCVTDSEVLKPPTDTPGVAFSFLRDILPAIEEGQAGGTTWAEREAWGSHGFAYFLCRGVSDEWMQVDPVTRAVRFTSVEDRPPGVESLPTACVESYVGFFHRGLPRPPNHPDEVAYSIPNPTIPYFCINHTVLFENGNNNVAEPDADEAAEWTDAEKREYEQQGPYLKYTVDCYAKDEFADRYLDENGYALAGGVGMPTTLPCTGLQTTDQTLKMVEACHLTVIANASFLEPDYAYACTIQCRYPCITQTEYMTYQSQTAASVCVPSARITQCNRDVRAITAQFCQPSETFAAFQVAPNAGLNTFENDIVTECLPGDLACRVFCHCRSADGCPNHIFCNQHGTLQDTSIESHPAVTPKCTCEPGYTGAECGHPVSSVICNHGQEL